MRELVRAVQTCGAKIACQLAYQTRMDVGPSAVPCFTYQVTPREMVNESTELSHKI